MAATSDVVILYEDPIWKSEFSKLASEVVDRGDFMSYVSGTHDLEVMDAVGENTTFIGVSCDKSAAADTYKILVLHKGIVDVKVTDTAYEVGKALKWEDGDAGDPFSFEGATTGQDGILWVLEYSASGTGPVKCAFDVFLIGIGAGSGAGLFEGFAG